MVLWSLGVLWLTANGYGQSIGKAVNWSLDSLTNPSGEKCMWLAIWGCFAAFIVAFVGWTLVVLMQQKRAWANFAKKNKLKYTPGSFMGSPTVTGEMGKWNFSLYAGVQQTDDIRGQRFVSVIEFQLGRGMPTGAAIATKEFAGFINGLVFDKDFRPALAEWDKSYIARTRSVNSLGAYMTKERTQLLHSLFGLKNSAALFFFDEIEAVLRIETTDPLRNEEHLSKIVNRIMNAVERLSPTDEEKKVFRQLLLQEKKRREQGLDEDDNDTLTDSVTLAAEPEASPPPPVIEDAPPKPAAPKTKRPKKKPE